LGGHDRLLVHRHFQFVISDRPRLRLQLENVLALVIVYVLNVIFTL
jgi:hypothetical protein